MKIVVLGGSPKGEHGLTHLYARFIGSRFPRHDWTLLELSPICAELEADTDTLMEIIGAVRAADVILWSFPVYYYLVPAPYKRFIELIYEQGADEAFKGKYAAVLTTSIHFFDHTAHSYLHAVCDDLGMRYAGFHSASMDDILREQERDRLQQFAEQFLSAAERGIPVTRTFPPLAVTAFNYRPGHAGRRIDTKGKKVIVVTDGEKSESNLAGMIRRFGDSCDGAIEVINLRSVDIAGGCTGCVQCGYDNVCIYRDGYREMFSRVQSADIIIFAGAIRDRYLSSRWKLFFDRSFFNNHVPALAGKQLGFIISGPLGQLPNLSQILQAYTEIQQANLAGFVTDEFGDSAEIDELLQTLAAETIRLSETGFVRSPTYLSIGGKKLFRDVVWGRFRHIFPADHRFYKRHGIYDFPQYDYGIKLMNGILYPFTRTRKMRLKTIEKLQELRKRQIRAIIGKQDVPM